MRKRVIRLAVLISVIAIIFAVAAVGCKPEVDEGGNQIEESFKVRFFDGDAVYYTAEGKSGDSLTLPADPDKEGYRFDGWAESANGAISDVATAISENRDYFAVFTKLWVVTLDANGGTVSENKVNVADGESLYEAVKDRIPTINGDATFGAWFEGETEINASVNLTVGSDKTLTARYKVGYTVNVYKEKVGENGAGSGEYDIISTEGNDYVGKRVTPAAADLDKYHYANNTEDVTTKVLSQTKAENIFTFHYDLDEYQVYFKANAPEGADVTGNMEAKTVVPDVLFDVPNEFIVKGYRFAGWAEKADGAVKYLPNERVSIKLSTTFYAVWDKAYIDSHGGLDLIFLSSSQPDVSYLQREGLEEKQGTYNADTRMFKFVTDAGEDLIGRISRDGSAFAYFTDDVNEVYYVYNAYDWYPTMATLTLKTYNDAVLTDPDGKETNGFYRVDDVSGDYVFVRDDGEERQFTLTYSASSGKSVCLLRGEETGEYYYFSPISGQFVRSLIVYLDGYGAVLYKDGDEQGSGTYRYYDEETIFMRVSIGDKILSQYIRLTDRNGTPVYYEGTSFNGTFTDGDDRLTLDGFGKGSYIKNQISINGTYTYDTMTYAIDFIGEDGQNYSFDVNPYDRTFKAADELTGVYWWYRGAVLTVQLVIQCDGVVYMYADSDNGMVAFAYGAYEEVKEGVYRYETEEWNPAIPAYFSTYFLNFDFILDEHDYAGVHFKTFSQCYNELKGITLTTADGGAMTLDEYSGVTYQKGSVTLTGWYDFVKTEAVSRLDIAINNRAYSFIHVDVEGIKGKYLEVISTYNVYHNFLEIDLGMWLLADNYALLIDFDNGVPFAFAKYSEGATRYNLQKLNPIYEGYEGYEPDWYKYGFSFVTRTVDDDEVFIVNSTSKRLILDINGADGQVRFDAYGYAWYTPTGASAAMECEYVLYMEDLQLKSVATGVIYELVLTNFLSDDEADPSFVNKGDNLIFYIRDGSGFGPNHYMLAPGGEGTYYRYISNGDSYNVTTYELTWVFKNGIYTVNYDGKTVRFVTDAYQVDWAAFHVVVEEKTVADGDKFDYQIVDKDKETVIGRLYNEGFGNFYRDDTDGSVYDITVYREENFVAVYIKYANGLSDGMFFDFTDEQKTTVWLRGVEGGAGEGFTSRYNLCEYGVLFNDTYFTFDGHSVARYVADGNLHAEGTYSLDNDGNYIFTYEENGQTRSFAFRIEMTVAGYYGFVKLHENYGGGFNNDDWIYLELDIYANYAKYTDRYGYTHEGNYLGLSDTAIKFTAVTLEKPLCFRLNKANGTFEIITDDVLIEDGQLLILLAETDSIKIPDGITSIQAAFFRDNTTIKEVDLNEVTQIGASAFENCTALERVVGGNVTVISGATFKNCSNLREIDLSTVVTVGREAFYLTKLKAIDLAAAETIGESAFQYVKETETVTLGSHIRTIADGAFSGYGSEEGVGGLKEMDLPELTEVGVNAFAGVQTLVRVNAPKLKTVGHSAFRYCYELTSFTFENVVNIDEKAFQYCGFTEIVLPNVVMVGTDAFTSCGKLERAVFGAKAETIGTRISPEGSYIQGEYHYIDGEGDFVVPAFNTEAGDRISLVSIEIDPSNQYYRVENNCLIDRGTHKDSQTQGYETVVWGCATSEIPTAKSVRFIAKYAFSGTAVVRFNIPDNIDTVCVGAFEDCSKLVALTLGKGLNKVVHGKKIKYDENGNVMLGMEGNVLYDSSYSIGGHAFVGCKNIKEIYNKTGANLAQDYGKDGLRGISLSDVHLYDAEAETKLVEKDGFIFYADGESVELVGYDGEETTLTLPAGYGADSIKYALGKKVFSGKAFVSITLPDWMTEIPDSAFYGCRYLTSFTIPDGVTAINNNAFYGCTALRTVVIPGSVATIGESAFEKCANLTTVTFKDGGLKEIGKNAFKFCGSLKSITLPTTTLTIGESAFNASGLTEITVPGQVRTVGRSAFANCLSLIRVDFAEGLIELNEMYVFDNCVSLKTVNLPSTLKSIGAANAISGAFFACAALESVVIPDGVTTMGVYVFSYCAALKSVKLSAKLTSIPEFAFSGCAALEEIALPDSVTKIDTCAFWECGSLKTLIIGSGLRTITDDVFAECYSLEKIYFHGTEEEWESVEISYNYNDILFFVEVYFYSEEEIDDGSHWHYDNNEIVVWKK